MNYSITRAVATDPWTVLPLLMMGTTLVFYTMIRPDPVGGQFVAGFALGLMFLVAVVGHDKARSTVREQARRDRNTALARQ